MRVGADKKGITKRHPFVKGDPPATRLPTPECQKGSAGSAFACGNKDVF